MDNPVPPQHNYQQRWVTLPATSAVSAELILTSPRGNDCGFCNRPYAKVACTNPTCGFNYAKPGRVLRKCPNPQHKKSSPMDNRICMKCRENSLKEFNTGIFPVPFKGEYGELVIIDYYDGPQDVLVQAPVPLAEIQPQVGSADTAGGSGAPAVFIIDNYGGPQDVPVQAPVPLAGIERQAGSGGNEAPAVEIVDAVNGVPQLQIGSDDESSSTDNEDPTIISNDIVDGMANLSIVVANSAGPRPMDENMRQINQMLQSRGRGKRQSTLQMDGGAPAAAVATLCDFCLRNVYLICQKCGNIDDKCRAKKICEKHPNRRFNKDVDKCPKCQANGEGWFVEIAIPHRK